MEHRGIHLVNPANIRNFQAVIDIDKNVSESEFPIVKFYGRCHSLFTFKRDLQNMRSEKDTLALSNSSHHSSHQDYVVS